MHGLLMPDTPGLAALRVRINELGTGPMLMNLARQVTQPILWRSGLSCPLPAR